MSNYNFTPTLNGLNNIDADEIVSNNINSDTATINNLTVPNITGDNLTNCTLINCDVDSDPTDPLGVVSKQYVDNNLLNYALLGFPNAFSSSNTFSNISIFNATSYFNSVPECTGNPTINNHLMRKSYGDTTYCSLNDTNNLYGQNTFNTFCPQTSIAPSVNNSLCNKNYVDNSSHSLAGYAKLADANVFTAIQNYNLGIKVGNPSGGNQLIQARVNTGNFDLLTEMQSIINLGNNLNTATLEYNTFIDLFKTKNITGTTTLAFPLIETNIIRTTTSNITITLPLVSSVHIGLTIKFFKTSSNTHTVTLTPNASNRILYDCDITEQTSDPSSLNENSNYCSLTVSILNSGLYGWISAISPNNKYPITSRDCGVFLLNGAPGAYYSFPLFISAPDLTNFTNQIEATGTTVLNSETVYGGVVGTYLDVSIQDTDDVFIVYPRFGIVVYDNFNFTGTIRLNYYNNGNNVKTVKPSLINNSSSVRVLYDHVLL